MVGIDGMGAGGVTHGLKTHFSREDWFLDRQSGEHIVSGENELLCPA